MRSLNEKVSSIYCVFLVLVCCICGGSCTTTKSANSDITDIVSGNSYAAGQLEATVNALDGTVANSRERVENIIVTSRKITDGIERIEYLFIEYESEVNRLLNEIDRIRSEIEIQSESDHDCSTGVVSRNSDKNSIDYPTSKNGN